MAKISDPLRRTRPLSDPLNRFTWMLVILAFFFPFAHFTYMRDWPWPLVVDASCMLLAVVLLVAPRGKPNAIYLRAFKTDRATARLRLKLAAILGPKFRLSGIRPPRKKAWTFFRFLMPYLFVMRYAGSKFMELEAGDDWMARLWKTYRNVRLVFIDVRAMTVHVHEEIQMTLEAVDFERIIFLVDKTRSLDDWRQAVAAVAGPEADPSRFQILDVDSPQMKTQLKAMITALPAGVVGASEGGRQFVLNHVDEKLLKKSRHISPLALIGSVIALLVLLFFPLMWSPSPDSLLIPLESPDPTLGPLVGVSLAILFPLLILSVPLFRNLSRSIRLARAGHGIAAALGLVMVAVAIFLAVTPEAYLAMVIQAQHQQEEQLVGALLMPPPPPAPTPETVREQAPGMRTEKGTGNAHGGSSGSTGSIPGSGNAPKVHASAPNKINISAGVAASMLIQKVRPMYPPIARAAMVSGTVVLQAKIGKDGTVEDVSVVSGSPMLQQAALDAVRQWRYQPYLHNGEPVEVETTVNVIFTLGG